MGSVGFIFLVLILFSVNISAKQLHQNPHQPSLKNYQNRRTISTNEFNFPANAVHQMPSSDNLANLPEFTEFGKKEVHENVKAIILTKRVPVPYTVHVEKKVPYPVRFPVRRPFAVYVPKPYVVEFPKHYPFAVKVPMPQPYPVEKQIPFPVKVPVDKPYPVHIPKPYPVYVEKKIPVPVEKHIPIQIKIPFERPYPVHIPVEKSIPYPVEKPVTFPIKVPIESPIPVTVIKPIHFPIEHVIEKPQTAELLPENNLIGNENIPKKLSASNFQPSTYDPMTSSLITQGSNKAFSFLPGSTPETYSLGTIHVPDTTQSQSWNISTTDWIPKSLHYDYDKPQKVQQHLPKSLNTVKYVYPEGITTSLNLENMASFSDSPTLKETHGIMYEPVKYEAFKQEISKPSQQSLQQLEQQQQQLHQQQQNLQQQQETGNSYQTSLLTKSSQPISSSNYQYFSIHPHIQGKSQEKKSKQTSPEAAISYQRFETLQPTQIDTKWIPQALIFNKPQTKLLTQQPKFSQEEKLQYEDIPQYTYQLSQLVQPGVGDHKYQGSLQYQTAEVSLIPTAQAIYMTHPVFQHNIHNTEQPEQQTMQYQSEKPIEHYRPDNREEFQPQYNEPVIYGQTIQYHYGSGSKPMNTMSMPQTNSHAGMIEQTTVAQQTTLPATTQQLESTSSTTQSIQNNNNISTEATKKNDDISNHNFELIQKQNIINNVENAPITYTDINRNFIRKTRRKAAGKRKNILRDTVEHTVKAHIS